MLKETQHSHLTTIFLGVLQLARDEELRPPGFVRRRREKLKINFIYGKPLNAPPAVVKNLFAPGKLIQLLIDFVYGGPQCGRQTVLRTHSHITDNPLLQIAQHLHASHCH